MATTFPGTTIEVSALQKGCSKQLFDGIFATGGITLSQVSVMTGLEPYLIQNWIKRGFVSPPIKRVYSREQFARIVLINMLREELQIDRICGLLTLMGATTENPDDDWIGDADLYHRYVDMIADSSLHIADEASVLQAAELAIAEFEERVPHTKKQLIRVLQVMFYAHAAAKLRHSAEEVLATLQ